MTSAARSRVVIILRAVVPLVLVAGAAAILLRFPPAQYSFYPQCPLYVYFHLQCPGCGSTRALAALLQGHVLEALRLNALTTLLAPFAAIYAADCYRRFLQRKPFHWPQSSPAGIHVVLAVAVIFSIIRNLHLI